MKPKQLLVLGTTLVSIFGIYWINAGQTALKRTGEVAGREEVINYTLPPGFMFSIWGVIYLGFLIYALYWLKPSASEDPQLQATVYPVTLSMGLNLLWVVLVGLDAWVAAYFLQWVMLAVAVVLLLRWDLKQSVRSRTQQWLSLPFGLYAGWVTVAMIPFTSDLLNQMGWDGGPLSRPAWAIILYVAACVIVVAAYQRLRQPFYLLPLVWALFGYTLRFAGEVQWVAVVLASGLFLYFLTQVAHFYSRKKSHLRVPDLQG